MASQAQLEADIALAKAQVASLELQLDAASGSPQPDPAVIADLERQLETAKNALILLQNELNNLLVASDPNTNIGTEAQIPVARQDINADPNTNIGVEGQIAGQKTVTGPTGTPYDDNGNLNVGWGLDENGNPVWVTAGYVDATGQTFTSAPQSQPDSSPTGPARDDNGNLMPGWNEDEFGTPYYVGNGFVAPTTQASANATRQGITTNLANTQGDATNQDSKSFEKAKDWRVRLSLAPSAKYLYKADVPGILKPLQSTNGVIFPYTPTVSAVYAASYDSSELVHSNYKIYNYKNSNVDTVTITGDFTAQDTNEANYLLAVIHFFKSVTKMFYGQDQNPRNGTPPPLVYMSGLGTFQFDNHPLAVTNFTYSLPNEVDYIRAGSTTNEPGSSTAGQTTVNNTDNASTARIQSSGLGVKVPNFQRQQATINSNATYVPTKMQIVITCIPIVTRNDISNRFSLRDYATGALLQGSKNSGGGIW
jgi:hypothetical protein